LQPTAASSELEALRAGDEAAFLALVRRHHGAMVRVAQIYVGNRAIAEEVAQEAWVGALKGLERFEGRASLKTWLFRILINGATKRAARERRSVPFSALQPPETSDTEEPVEADRFLDAGHRWANHWRSPPQSWDGIPETRLLSKETLALVEESIETLPPQQRDVIWLRDVSGWTAAEVCNVLQLSETNQRVLLHRARSKVRRDLERYVERERRG
jgi:RNA polymerase sigma-70 factor (ECF subfamily)